MKIVASLLLWQMVLCAGASELLRDSFESYGPGSISGQDGWVLDSGAGDVQASVAFSGLQSLELQGGTVSHSLSNGGSAVWTRFRTFVSGVPESDPVIDVNHASVAFYVNAGLTLTVYSNAVPVVLDVPVATNAWVRFDVFCDYDALTWNLSMNGSTMVAGLPLCSTNRGPDTVKISNLSSDSVFIDDLNIFNHEMASGAPDTDGDGIADWWEFQHFGSITGCVAWAVSGNNGLTYLETYICGVDPFGDDPFVLQINNPDMVSWSASPERTYDVEWTPDLSSNFTVISSVSWPNESYSNPLSGGCDAGFYRIKAFIEHSEE